MNVADADLFTDSDYQPALILAPCPVHATTKARLPDAAKRLVGAYGRHSVTVTEIARAAGVAHGMINAHFNARAEPRNAPFGRRRQ